MSLWKIDLCTLLRQSPTETYNRHSLYLTDVRVSAILSIRAHLESGGLESGGLES